MRIRALVLDDDAEIRGMLVRLLNERGYEVLAYSEPETCPVYLDPGCGCPRDQACADIILTDLCMPKASGVDFIEAQARGGCKTDIRNKAVASAFWTSRERLRAGMLGSMTLDKPFQMSLLRKWLAECESRIRPGRRLTPIDEIIGPRSPAAIQAQRHFIGRLKERACSDQGFASREARAATTRE